SRERFLEAWHPTNVAISLTGEPTLYRRLGEMIDEFQRRRMSTFLVTNGTTPAALPRLHAEARLPTQLYVTVAAPNETIYRTLVVPNSGHDWLKLKETLALLPTLPTRTALRHTLVSGRGWRSATDSARSSVHRPRRAARALPVWAYGGGPRGTPARNRRRRHARRPGARRSPSRRVGSTARVGQGRFGATRPLSRARR